MFKSFKPLRWRMIMSQSKYQTIVSEGQPWPKNALGYELIKECVKPNSLIHEIEFMNEIQAIIIQVSFYYQHFSVLSLFPPAIYHIWNLVFLQLYVNYLKFWNFGENFITEFNERRCVSSHFHQSMAHKRQKREKGIFFHPFLSFPFRLIIYMLNPLFSENVSHG